jgi:putative Ig domain-containing protein/ASPM-SPD-2-Hydin domain-containing protein
MPTVMRQTRWFLATFILVSGMLALNAPAQLKSTPSSLAFGNVYLGLNSTNKSISVENTGTASATITSVTSSCPEYKLASGTTPITIAAGKTATYSFYFVPNLAQAFDCQFTFAVESGTALVLPLTGTGVTTKAVVSLNANSLKFPNQAVGTASATQKITISNTGAAAIKVNTVTIEPATFSVSAAPSIFPLNIPPKGKATVTVTYSPEFAIAESGVLSFNYNQLPAQIVDLTGNGGASTALVITNIATLPQATASAAYQATLLASSGTSPYTFALQTGSSLPSGLILSTAGTISGTLASTVTAGSYTFTAQVTDAASHVATKAFTLGVSAATGASCNNISFDVPGTTTPIIPLNDLATGTYQGEEGGLYPNGSNVRPSTHDSDGVAFADAIQPLDVDGNPSPTGKYVMLALGESTALDEFGAFLPLVQHDPEVNPNLVVVDGAQGGATPGLLASMTSPYWNTILNNFLSDQGVTAQQVVAAWIEDSNGVASGSFPKDMAMMQGNYETVMNNLHTMFPHLTLVYFSSRIYAGYSNGVAKINPEPYAYEAGFAVKNAIADQLNGKTNLNYNPALGPVVAPWMSWGPYYWSNGLLARSDGFVWTCQDVQKDGTHPASPSGDLKVAAAVLNFFKTDDTTAPWFLKP